MQNLKSKSFVDELNAQITTTRHSNPRRPFILFMRELEHNSEALGWIANIDNVWERSLSYAARVAILRADPLGKFTDEEYKPKNPELAGLIQTIVFKDDKRDKCNKLLIVGGGDFCRPLSR